MHEHAAPRAGWAVNRDRAADPGGPPADVGEALVTDLADTSWIEANPVVLDSQLAAAPLVGGQPHDGPTRLRVADDVAEGLADDRQELAGELRRRLGDGIRDAQFEVDDGVVPVFLNEGHQAADQ